MQTLQALKRALLGEATTKGWHTNLQPPWQIQQPTPRWVLQVALLGERVGFCWMRGVALTHPAPGGTPRLRVPTQSPSRSAVKVEEALLLMKKMPAPRQRGGRFGCGTRGMDPCLCAPWLPV